MKDWKYRKRKQEKTDSLTTEDTGRRQKALTGSFPAKVLAFFLLTVSSFLTAVSGIGCAVALACEIYDRGFAEVFQESAYYEYREAAHELSALLQNGGCTSGEIMNFYSAGNTDVDILKIEDGQPGAVIWGTNNGAYASAYTMDFYMEIEEIRIDSKVYGGPGKYVFRVYAKPGLPKYDDLRRIFRILSLLYRFRFGVIWAALTGAAVTVLCFLFLMCGAGRSNRAETYSFQGIWLDLLAGISLGGLGVLYLVMFEWVEMLFDVEDSLFTALFLSGVAVSAAALWLTFCAYQAAITIKRGKWWKRTLTYETLKFVHRAFIALGRGCAAVLLRLPMIPVTLALFFGISLLEFVGCSYFIMAEEGVALWALEKVVLFVLVLYTALSCSRLLEAGKALAEGRQDHKVDTSGMIGALKKHGENLNSIGQGISRAVEERTKSERLKTELITNVSHDLKTPLTSIINYSGLICEEKTENKKITEYSQVLLRQSGRLKKLLEDLVEASKAATGNLEVNLEPCEAGVILSQAVGEYQQKLEEKKLLLLVSQPEEPVRILADGRRLWRVFDNLLSNICKYAQENSRVYLSVEVRGGEVQIIFRNMSKYALNFSGEELEERFVRGDRSRHMEGNGLGLSIAKSLVDLQNGTMEIVIDGDLFKVTIGFQELKA